ncbi:MAG: hypothetical protein QOF51_1110 [Chloroflexota bacterium]|nr:hypothetical protein [Chloroflexota bacterium]
MDQTTDTALVRRENELPALIGAVSVGALFTGKRPAEARRLVVNAKDALERRLLDEPEDYAALVALGEIDLRIGLVREAQELLYRASLQRPPSWEAYQRTSLMLRRAEEDSQHLLDRPAGSPPPAPLRALAARCGRWVSGWVGSAHVHRGGVHHD